MSSLIGDLLNNIAEFFNEIINLLQKIFNLIYPTIKTFFVNIFDGLFNGEYFKYYLSFLFSFFIILIYFLIYFVNPFDIKSYKYSQFIFLSFIFFFIFIFYFLVYRKESDINPYGVTNNQFKKEDANNKYEFEFSNFSKTLKNPLLNLFKIFFTISATLLLPILIITLIFYLLNNYQNSFNILQTFILLVLLISTLAIVAKLFNISNNNKEDKKAFCNLDKLKEEDNFFNFIKKIICIIKYFIFFIPCLLIILVEKFKDDLKLTHPTIFILLILEILLISIVFIIPIIFKYISQLNGNDLLAGEGPFYLNNYKEIGTYQKLSNFKSDSNTNTTYHNFTLPFSDEKYEFETSFNGQSKRILKGSYSYSISFYLYLNPQPKNTSLAYNKDTTLFNYADKPKILYDGKNRQLVIKSKTIYNENDQLDTIFRSNSQEYNNFELKYQKWMFFVINYDNNIIDIFIDGKLVTSKKNVPNFDGDDKISIGDIDHKMKNDGIHGGIKDIYYYNHPRQPSNIEFLFNLTNKDQ